MEGEEYALHLTGPQPPHQLPVEVQTRGGRGHGTGRSGIDRLIALPVLIKVRAPDVRRKGHVSKPFQYIRGGVLPEPDHGQVPPALRH